jgi:nitrate/TMAO reductase-like tetraheme cytochrome c subunit
LAAPVTSSALSQPPDEVSDTCLMCHSEGVDGSRFAESVHGAMGFTCTSCHTDLEGKDLPHETPLAKVDCAACHTDAVAAFATSVHAAAIRSDTNSRAATCVDCHTAHEIRASTDPASATYALNLPQTCSRCHSDPAVIAAGHIAAGNVGEAFKDSIHGRAISRSGLLVAANCTSCHNAHDILAKEDPDSTVFRANIPSTCAACHEGIHAQFARGSHGASLEAGRSAGPVCTDCHSAHQIQRADVGSWRLDTITECGTCHIDKIRTYRDTFHGQVTALGFQRVAKCSDCHGAHEVHPKSDPRSLVSKARVLATCQTCHEGATAAFAEYDPHADKNDVARNPELYYASRFMHWLLIGVFGFFGVHALLWLPRSAAERRRRRGQEPGA